MIAAFKLRTPHSELFFSKIPSRKRRLFSSSVPFAESTSQSRASEKTDMGRSVPGDGKQIRAEQSRIYGLSSSPSANRRLKRFKHGTLSEEKWNLTSPSNGFDSLRRNALSTSSPLSSRVTNVQECDPVSRETPILEGTLSRTVEPRVFK